MAGYSAKPLARKLGIGPCARVALPGAPAGFHNQLAPLPDAVRIKRRTTAPLDVVVAFFTREAALAGELERLGRTVFPDGGLWIAWPKRASGVPTDLTEDRVRALGLGSGLVDNKVCAIDETWSGLRLVHRLRDRPGGRRGGAGASA